MSVWRSDGAAPDPSREAEIRGQHTYNRLWIGTQAAGYDLIEPVRADFAHKMPLTREVNGDVREQFAAEATFTRMDGTPLRPGQPSLTVRVICESLSPGPQLPG